MKNLANKSKMNKVILGLTTVVLFIGLTSLTVNTIEGVWEAPASADKVSNPVKSSEATLKAGKKLYKTYCVACHGTKGKGDGLAAASLNPKPANFTTAKIQSQTDGAIYWKLTEGRSPMAAYKGTLTDTQRWNLVNYIRTFKK